MVQVQHGLIEWQHKPDDILALTQEAINKHRVVCDRISSQAADQCTFDNVFLQLARADAELYVSTEPLGFYQHVAPDQALRDASSKSEESVGAYKVDRDMRLDLFQAKQSAAKAIELSGQKLGHEEARLVEHMLRDGQRAGLALSEAKRAQLTEMRKELQRSCTEFMKNYSQERGMISFTLEELDGVPADVVKGYKKRSEGDIEVYDVTFRIPDIFPILKNAIRPQTRQRAETAYDSRLAINAPVVARAIELRREIARLLGYASWADYQTEPKMIGSAAKANQFLAELEHQLRPLGEQERSKLKALKDEEHRQRGLNDESTFNSWDERYYQQIDLIQALALDDNSVRPYFPVDHVVKETLDIYQHLLSVRFELIDHKAWAEDVQVYAVKDIASNSDDQFLGWCYLDLYPRAAKFGHAAVFSIGAGFEREDGTRNYTSPCMVANVAKSAPGMPALMTHASVVTFFHELGHALHDLCSRTRFHRFHGTSVAQDFVEAPSKMLENWCWEPKVLKRMSKHHETGEPLPDELIEKVVKSRFHNVGLQYLFQLVYAKFDMQIHTDPEPQDYAALFNKLKEDVFLVKTGPTPTPGYSANFPHIMGGYDAGYYGVTFAQVCAMDMYKTIFEHDPLDPVAGLRYRERVLRPGGSRDENESLTEFLGRPPTSSAFTEALFGHQHE